VAVSRGSPFAVVSFALMAGRPAPFVRSAEGLGIQRKMWDETLELFERECSVKLNLD
jgi:hypothetical protein